MLATMNWRSFTVPRRAAVWLAYLGILAFQPLFDPNSTWLHWALAVALAVVFIPIYGWTVRHATSRPFLWRGATSDEQDGAGATRGPGAVMGIALMLVLGIAASPLNSGSSVFMIYASATGGYLRPRNRARLAIAAAFLAVPMAALLSTVPREYFAFAFLPALIFVPIIGIGNYYERERSDSNARLRMAHDEIERLATIAERERIARDLHDLLGHTLSTITLKSELAARMAQRDAAKAEAEMRDVERISRDALGQVRAAVRGYRSGGLEGELANVKLALSAAQIEYDYYLERLDLPPAIEGVLALALREGVTNVIRHSRASTSQVQVKREAGTVVLTVEDDGSWEPSAPPTTGGLTIMRARVEALGGELELGRTHPGRGGRTRLVVRLPLDAPSTPGHEPGTDGASTAASTGMFTPEAYEA